MSLLLQIFTEIALCVSAMKQTNKHAHKTLSFSISSYTAALSKWLYSSS